MPEQQANDPVATLPQVVITFNPETMGISWKVDDQFPRPMLVNALHLLLTQLCLEQLQQALASRQPGIETARADMMRKLRH